MLKKLYNLRNYKQKYIHYKKKFYRILKVKSFINPNYFDKKIKFYVEYILPLSLIKKQYKFSHNIIQNSINQIIYNNNKKFIIPYDTNNLTLIKYYKKQGLNINDILYIILYHKTNKNIINYLLCNNIKLTLENLKYIFIDINVIRYDWQKIIKYIYDYQLVKTFLISNCDNQMIFNYIKNNLFDIKNNEQDYKIILNLNNLYYRQILLDNYLSFYYNFSLILSIAIYM